MPAPYRDTTIALRERSRALGKDIARKQNQLARLRKRVADLERQRQALRANVAVWPKVVAALAGLAAGGLLPYLDRLLSW